MTQAPPDVTAALLRDILARLTRIEAQLGTSHGPRDREDRALVPIMVTAAEGLPFRAGHLMTRARFVPALDAALVAADIDNEKQLGKLLRRLEGVNVDGVRLERAGRFWRFVECAE